eukprot:12718992-Prorocentrum_lima.AAC.1
MTSSLVGSEMCIRDRVAQQEEQLAPVVVAPTKDHQSRDQATSEFLAVAVSYTHLTLPTICSV